MRHLQAIARTLMCAFASVALWPSLGAAQVPRVAPLPEISPNHPGSCKKTVDGDSDGSPDDVTVHNYEKGKLEKSLVCSGADPKPYAVITYEYDAMGRMTAMKLDGAPDQDAGTQESGADPKSLGWRGNSQRGPVHFERVTFSYNDAGKLQRVFESGGASESYEYNDEGDLIAKVISSRSSCEPLGPPVHKATYIRKNGRIWGKVSKCSVTTYEYDSSGRLTKSHLRSTGQHSRPDIVMTYEYDKQGNLVKEFRKVITEAPSKGNSATTQTVSTTTYDFSCWSEN